MMTRPITEQMTLWGQRFDQEINAHRRLRESLAEADMEVPDGAEIEYGQDMESLAYQAANLLSTIHVALDRFIHNATATTMDPRYIIDGLLDDLGQVTSERTSGAAAHA
jgi:hypothetical protein